MRTVIWTFCLAIICVGARAQHQMETVAHEVLLQLYSAAGDARIEMPRLIVSQDSLNGARYLKRKNIIEISRKVYQICQKFEADSLDALAFILGHELAHAFQVQLQAHETSFLAREYHPDGDVLVEESADVQGLFLAYLAGYDQCRSVLPALLEDIYDQFQLNDVLRGYPDKYSRQKTAEKTIALATELIRIHEAGIYLMAAGFYELAATCFEYIAGRYTGRDILNNTGVCYALWAMNFSPGASEPFVFPFEVAWETRMNRVRGEALNAEEKAEQKSYLSLAEAYLSEAMQSEPSALAPKMNWMSVLILQGRADEARSLGLALLPNLDVDHSPGAASELVKLQLAIVLAYQYSKQEAKARELWELLSYGSVQARVNLAASEGDRTVRAPLGSCILPSLGHQVDEVILHRLKPVPPFLELRVSPEKQVTLSIQEKTASLIYIFTEDASITMLQRVFSPLPELPEHWGTHVLFTEQGQLRHCAAQRLVCLTDQEQHLVEWATYLSLQR